MKNFTVEETNLMCCFNTSSRKRLIDDMKSVTLNDIDGEIAELVGNENIFTFGKDGHSSRRLALCCHLRRLQG